MRPRSLKVILYFVVLALMAFCITATYAQALKGGLSLQSPGQGVISNATGVVYSQPPSPGGGLIPSSWWDPDGSASDRYVWDDFTFQASQDITEISWVGGYDPTFFGSGGPVLDFTVAIYPTSAGGSQPDILNPLVSYQTGGNAGETPAGSLGGIAMYNYSFVLPVPFTAAASTKYWVQIYAWQNGTPDWGLTTGTGGDGAYFFRIHGNADIYQLRPGDAAFKLIGPMPVKHFIYLPAITH